jgi:RND family efflux transporter MFP subunit
MNMANVKSASVLLAALVLLSSAGCSKTEIEAPLQVHKPVEVVQVSHQMYDLKQMYTGRIDSDTAERLSFLAPGKISSLKIKSGDQVKKGQLLAQLDNRIQTYGASGSGAQVEAAKSVAEKARLALEHLEKTLEDLNALYEQGAVSKSELDGTALQAALAKADLKSAQAQLRAAQAGHNVNNSYVSDTKIYAPRDGTVLEVLYQEGDLVSAGYPVIMLEGQTPLATFGMSAETLIEDGFEREVDVYYGDNVISGFMTKIHPLPDPATMTYEVEVALPSGKYLIGAMVDIFVKSDQVRAVKLPIDIVLSGESDFVFVVKEGKAIKKNVKILSVQDNELLVEGLEDGDQVIVKGMKLVNPLDNVEITGNSR